MFGQEQDGQKTELGMALRRCRNALISVGLLSAMLNVLLLGGSIYMMMIYDQVLPSHSLPTLFGLLAMIIVVYLFQGVLDYMRSRMLANVGASLDLGLTSRVQRAISYMALNSRQQGDGLHPMRDLDQIRGFLASPGPTALIDLPWVIFFLGVLYLMHFWLGVTATVGAIILAILTIMTDKFSRDRTRRLSQANSTRSAMAEGNRRHAEVIQALGMQGRMQSRWQYMSRQYLGIQMRLTQLTSTLGGASKTFRMFLQSLVLTVGALLVIDGNATGGIIFAGSIIASRALAPVELSIANWRQFTAARQGWKRLNDLLPNIPHQNVTTVLPPPVQDVSVEALTVVPPGSQRVAAQNVSFRLEAGDALGVIGPSGSGKSSLARALVGIWQAARGTVRLDGAALDQWDGEALGQHIGYLPQSVELIEGTIAENISRFVPEPPSDAIIAAARAAGVHELILRMPDGYETQVGKEGYNLSAGQRQRVALARALYGDPFFVVLDEPNSNLDSDGEIALSQAIADVRARKGIVVIVAHRPAVLEHVNLVLYMREGQATAFGKKEEVLQKVLAKPVSKLTREGDDSPRAEVN